MTTQERTTRTIGAAILALTILWGVPAIWEAQKGNSAIPADRPSVSDLDASR